MIYSVLEGKTTIKSNYLDKEIYNYLDTTFEIPENLGVTIVDVTEDFIARPDLVSLKAYGNDSYADVICKINGISNPFELNDGDKLVLPNYEYLRDFLPRPSDMELEDTDNSNVPVSKKPGEKRKANEAVVGDKRFSIDKDKRVIIY